MSKVGNVAKSGRINWIDTVKGVAILFVLLQHCGFSDKTMKIALFPYFENLAIPIFMTISGFTFTLSLRKAMKGNFGVIKYYFDFRNLKKKVIRILPAYTLVFILEIVLDFLKNGNFSFKNLLLYFVGGLNFPGSYYIPVLVELVIIFPFLVILHQKLPKGLDLLLVLLVQVAYEVFIFYAGIPEWFTRLLVIRYLLFVVLGIYLFESKDKEIPLPVNLTLMILGLAYITAIGYFNCQPKVIFATWTNTALPTAFFVFPVLYFIQKKFGKSSRVLKFNLIGKASFHIYLVQMMFFGFFWKRFDAVIMCCIGIPVSCVLGILFYKAEPILINKFRRTI